MSDQHSAGEQKVYMGTNEHLMALQDEVRSLKAQLAPGPCPNGCARGMWQFECGCVGTHNDAQPKHTDAGYCRQCRAVADAKLAGEVAGREACSDACESPFSGACCVARGEVPLTPDSAGVLERIKKEAGAEWKERAERAETQLGGCGVAALGWSKGEQRAKPGDWGWSASYQEVMDLRQKYEAALAKLEDWKEVANGDDAQTNAG